MGCLALSLFLKPLVPRGILLLKFDSSQACLPAKAMHHLVQQLIPEARLVLVVCKHEMSEDTSVQFEQLVVLFAFGVHV